MMLAKYGERRNGLRTTTLLRVYSIWKLICKQKRWVSETFFSRMPTWTDIKMVISMSMVGNLRRAVFLGIQDDEIGF